MFKVLDFLQFCNSSLIYNRALNELEHWNFLESWDSIFAINVSFKRNILKNKFQKFHIQTYKNTRHSC